MYAVSIGPWIFLSLDGEHTMELSDDVKKGLIAGAFGLIGTLFPVVLSWSRDRDAASTRHHKIDEATKRVAFWDQWLKLYSQLESPSGQTASQRVQKELALLGDIIENDSLIAHTQSSRQQEKTSQFTERIISLPAWRRFFLLYRPERSLAWFPRLLFYSGLLSIILFIAVQFTESKAGNTSAVGGLFIFEFMAVVWCTVFRYLSRFLEQPHGPSIPVTTSVPPPPKG
jgi:hypothetical protein